MNQKNLTIAEWPAEERPREKLLLRGAEALSDAELLAIFIWTGIQGKTAVDLARELLNSHGSLRALLEASHQKICSHPGLGSAKYTLLHAALEIGRRYLKSQIDKTDITTNTIATRRYLTSCLRHYQHEVFACLFLDNHNRIIKFEELFTGTINYANIYPREVIKRALAHNASGIIFAHNHPSGMARPSEEDKQITKLLSEALEYVQVRTLDHIIIGDGQSVSFAELGLIW